MAHCILSFEGTSYKLQLVCQFLDFLMFYITSGFASADIISNIYWKKYFDHEFSFFNRFTQTPQMTKCFCWCTLDLENFWFYIWVVVLWLNFSTHLTLRHLLLSPWIKYLSAKTIKYILKYWEKLSVKRKSNISFRVIKKSSFDQSFLMVKTFLKILW